MSTQFIEELRAITPEQIEFCARKALEIEATRFLELHGYDRNGYPLPEPDLTQTA